MKKLYILFLVLLSCLFLDLSLLFAQDAPKEQNNTNQDLVAPEIIFQGKLYASLTRGVPIPYHGIVTAVHVKPGQSVKEGDVLASLELNEKVVSSLRKFFSSQTIQNIQVRKAQVAMDMKKINVKLKEVQSLVDQNMASKNDLQQLQGGLSALKLQQKLLVEQEKNAKQSESDELKRLRKIVGDTITQENIPEIISIKAPIDGHILLINPNFRLGAEVKGGQCMSIGVMDPMIIRANVFEIEASRLKVGDKAEVSLSSVPDKKFAAVVTSIDWTPIKRSRGLDQPSYYGVELEAPNPDFILKEGYKTNVKMLLQ